jgi:hypothetical protein
MYASQRGIDREPQSSMNTEKKAVKRNRSLLFAHRARDWMIAPKER